ncbi:STE3-domain-containing protein [Coprinellus micaceus]|uniref:STE3-domain-containing protein n=1 Tax=Coprinellus micaceus TaxID=71717 RepID=A0A4Y7SD12_COPMI|nr:STE3-domain-containing protein [Coprinellus micaceus]
MAIHPELAPIAAVACLASLLPLPWHWRARNIATLSIVFWFFVSNLIFGVNAAVWADNVEIRAEIWCDISSKLVIGANIGLPSACLCVAVYLEQVASLRRATHSLADKRRRQWFEGFMGFGMPIVFMALHVIVQGHRYDIIEGYGCRPTTYYSIPSIFIVYIPPLLMALGCLVFSGLAIRHFIVRRLTFAAHLQQSNSALTASRYLRLIAMAVAQMFGVVGITSYTLWFATIAVPLRPWTSWDDVHSDFWRVDVFLARFYPQPVERAFYGMWMVVPLSTFVFVAFFSFGRDAVDEYRKCFDWVKVNIFRMKKSDGSKKLGMKGPKFSFIKSLNSSPKPRAFPVISQPVLQSITSLEYSLPPYDTLYNNAGTSGTVTPVEQASTTLHGHSRSGSSSSNDTHVSNEFEYKYKLRDSRSRFTDNFTTSPTRHSFKFAQPKAIGSYSDLSICSPSSSTVMSPSSTVISSSEPSPKKVKEDLDVPVSPLTNYVTSSHPREYYAPQPESQRRTPSPSPIPVAGRPSRSLTVSITVPEPIHGLVHAPTSAGSRLRPLLLGQGRESWRPVTYPSHEAETWSVDTTEGRS